MSIFSRIRKRIESIFSNFIREKQEMPITYSDIIGDLTQITKKQEAERKTLVEKIENSIVYNLSETQIKLIEKKSEALNIRKSQNDFEKFREINYMIERLETNCLLQSKIKFLPNKIADELIGLLSIELKEERPSDNLLQSISEKRLKFEEARQNDLESINNLKKKALNFSLIQIHQKREEERKEKERIERERKINIQFEKHIKNSRKQQSLNHYDKAEIELLEAISLKPDKEKDINDILTDLKSEKQEFEKRLTIFKEIFDNAEKSFHSGNLEQAISKYKKAIELNIDNKKCERRISDARCKIKRLKELEEIRLRREKEEKERREKYKKDADEILKVLEDNGIKKLYHFTDSDNINSIIKYGGLFSWDYCEKNNIPVKSFGGDEQSRRLDKRYGLENYVRLSYNPYNPMSYIAKKEGRIKVLHWLTVDRKAATLRHALFSNMNATKTGFKKGDNADFLKVNVKFDVVKWKNQWHPQTKEKSHYYQAEVMIKEKLPIEFITNINS